MYDDYMQNFFGVDYSPYENTYDLNYRNTSFYNQSEDYNHFNYPFNYMYQGFSFMNAVTALEDLYPEIYKIIYPMVQKACSQNTHPINDDVLDEITNDIYSNIEADNIINLNINIDNNRNENKSISNSKNVDSENKDKRHFNPVRDLIKILLIRELGGKSNFNRPPRPFSPCPPPPRPPMHGHLGNPLPRPRY